MLVLVTLLTTSAQACAENTAGLDLWSAGQLIHGFFVCVHRTEPRERRMQKPAPNNFLYGILTFWSICLYYLFQLQLSSRHGKQYAIFFVLSTIVCHFSPVFSLSYTILPSLSSKVKFLNFVPWCSLSAPPLEIFMLSVCRWTFSWSSLGLSFILLAFFKSFQVFLSFWPNSAFWFPHIFFKESLLPCQDVSSPSPLPPCLLSPHIYVGGKMSCWLGCWWGSWGFRVFSSRHWSCAFVESYCFCMKSLIVQPWFTQWSSWNQQTAFVLSPVSAYMEACQ